MSEEEKLVLRIKLTNSFVLMFSLLIMGIASFSTMIPWHLAFVLLDIAMVCSWHNAYRYLRAVKCKKIERIDFATNEHPVYISIFLTLIAIMPIMILFD